MGNIFSTWLMIAYGLSALGYLGRFVEGIPNVGILIGMVLISSAYGFMFLSKIWTDKQAAKEDSKTDAAKKDTGKKLTVIGYSLAALFFFGIHLVPQLTFTVRFYDIFGAVGYGAAAIGTALLPALLPIGYAIAAVYYVLGSYQKVSQSGWIDRIQLISRTLLAFIYGVTALSFTNV